MRPFTNEPLTDFSKPANQKAFQRAIAKVEKMAGKKYPAVIGGKEVRNGKTFDSTNPSKPSQVLGTFTKSGAKEARSAVTAAGITYPLVLELSFRPGIFPTQFCWA